MTPDPMGFKMWSSTRKQSSWFVCSIGEQTTESATKKYLRFEVTCLKQRSWAFPGGHHLEIKGVGARREGPGCGMHAYNAKGTESCLLDSTYLHLPATLV